MNILNLSMLGGKIKKHLLLIFLIGVVFIVVIGAYFFFSPERTVRLSIEKADIQLSLGVVPIGTLYSLTPARTLRAVTVPNMSAMQVIDTISTENATFYLLGDPSTLTSNVYKNENGLLTQITNSPTLKFSLSYDPVSRTFAFLSGSVQGTRLQDFTSVPWNITISDSTSGERTLPVSGASPIILKGGSRVIAVTGSSLSALDTKTGAMTKLLEHNPGSPYAVSANGTILAVYNSVTNAVDFFDIRSALPSYIRSQQINTQPLVLGFLDDTLLTVSPGSGNVATLIFSFPGTSVTFETENSFAPALPQKLIISHAQ